MKNILIIALLFFTGSLFAQPTTTITNPVLKGFLKVGNTYMVDSTNKIWFSNPIKVTTQLEIGTGIIKDSTSNYIIFNKAPVFNTTVKWLDGSKIQNGTITATQISSGTITSGQISTGLKDSLFSSSTVAGVNLLIEAERTRMNRLFSSTGNFKSGVLQGALSLDTSLNQLSVVVDTSKGIRISGGKITSDMADVYDFATNKFISEVKVGSSILKDSTNGVVQDSLNLRGHLVFVRNGTGIAWGGTFSFPTYASIYHSKLQPRLLFQTDGDMMFRDIDETWNVVVGSSGINIETGEYQIGGTSIFGLVNTYTARQNFTDTVDFDGSTVINFPTVDAINVSSSGTLYDAIINNSLSLGIAFDGSAPGTNLSGGASGSYYGSSGANYLGDPNKWMIITLNGTPYRIPLYTP